MKTKKILFFLLIVAFAIFMVGCDKDDESVNEFNLLVEYIEGNDGGYPNNMGSWILKEGDINTDDYLVLDLRSATDFAAMHIDGAINTTLSDMFDEVAKTNSDKVLVTCYSGQTAAFGHMLLRLKGIEAYSMMFGMSWHDASLDKWTSNCSDKNAGDLAYTASPTLPTYDYPELDTGEETAEAILDARIEAAIEAWGNGLLISSDDVIDDASAYNIMNYWGTTDSYHAGNPYETLGHIDGAYQLVPGTLTTDGNLNVFDPNGTNIFYCWTGQTAAAEIAYLAVLGYEAKSIKFGFNNMNWSALQGHKWSKPWG